MVSAGCFSGNEKWNRFHFSFVHCAAFGTIIFKEFFRETCFTDRPSTKEHINDQWIY